MKYSILGGVTLLLFCAATPAANTGRDEKGGNDMYQVLSSRIEVSSPLQLTYFHVQDDDGTAPQKNTDVILVFEPQERSLLYVESAADMIAHHGTWQYGQGRLTLRFQCRDLKVDAAFALDLGQAEVTMPFRIFSEGKGWSKWRRRLAVVESILRVVFRGAVIDEAQPLKTEEAIGRAKEFADAVIAMYRQGRPAAARAAAPFLPFSFSTPLAAQDAGWLPGDWLNNLPVSASPLANGVQLTYLNGSKADVLLFGWAPPPAVPLVLRPGRLVSDPRVHINVEASQDPRFDPPHKTALYISPFETGRIISWYDRIFHRALNTGIVPALPAEFFDWEGTAAKLAERGYSLESLKDENVTVERLITLLVRTGDPGIMVFYTHGTSSGALATGEKLCNVNDPILAEQKLEEVKQRLRNAGHGRLVDMGGIARMSIELQLKAIAESAWFVSICPPFWQYVQSLTARPVSFKRGLVYIAACATDGSTELREAIRAGAYFAWNVSISPALCGAVLQYLVAMLARPTRSAEEAYYNLVRVVNTREMIYKEDRLLRGQVPADESQNKTPIFQNLNQYCFNGYGIEGTKPVCYAGNGWLSPKLVDVGQVWWLAFAGRWGKSARQGADNLRDCYKNFWSSGNLGRMKNVFCNAANNGKPPKAGEVAYAAYLLTGDRDSGFKGQWVPRWTLSETR